MPTGKPIFYLCERGPRGIPTAETIARLHEALTGEVSTPEEIADLKRLLDNAQAARDEMDSAEGPLEEGRGVAQ